MSSVLTKKNLDLIALNLDSAELAKQVTGLELLQHFELIDGFWHACVEMVTPSSEDVAAYTKILTNRTHGQAGAWSRSLRSVFGIKSVI